MSVRWQPGAGNNMLKQRAKLLSQARQFFAMRGVLEVETPIFCAYGITEPHVESIALFHSAQRAWLRTSPEYHMKRLLAAGSPDIYQIGKCFRAGEQGSKHQPEFTMIEWYRHDFSLAQMYTECCELIIALGADTAVSPEGFYTHRYAEIFEEHCGINPLTAATEALKATAGKLTDPDVFSALANDTLADRSSWLDLLTAFVVYPALPPNQLHVVIDYPREQAMLAKLSTANPQVAERFEIFLNGLELANGFAELTDAAEQSRRFAQDRARRRKLGKDDMESDLLLLAALDSGLPECCGVAVGFDRTLMALENIETLEATLSFAPGT
jgi:lysyl-tRNA synthetase class 2